MAGGLCAAERRVRLVAPAGLRARRLDRTRHLGRPGRILTIGGFRPGRFRWCSRVRPGRFRGAPGPPGRFRWCSRVRPGRFRWCGGFRPGRFRWCGGSAPVGSVGAAGSAPAGSSVPVGSGRSAACTGPRERQDRTRAIDMLAPTTLLGRTLLTALVVGIGFAGFESTFSLLGRARVGLTEAKAGLVFAGVGIVCPSCRRSAGEAGDRRIGAIRTARTAVMVNLVGFAVLIPAGGWTGLVPALLLLSIGQGLLTPAMSTVVSSLAPPDRRGAVFGVQQSVSAASRVIGPLVALGLFGIGIPLPYVLGVGLALVGLLALSSLPAGAPLDALHGRGPHLGLTCGRSMRTRRRSGRDRPGRERKGAWDDRAGFGGVVVKSRLVEDEPWMCVDGVGRHRLVDYAQVTRW